MRRGLTIVISGADPDRLRGALGVAAAEAALGGRVRLFFDAGAVTALAAPGAPAAGLLAAARDLGVAIIACQTGLAEQGLALAALGADVEAGGLVALLADLGEDRLLLA